MAASDLTFVKFCPLIWVMANGPRWMHQVNLRNISPWREHRAGTAQIVGLEWERDGRRMRIETTVRVGLNHDNLVFYRTDFNQLDFGLLGGLTIEDADGCDCC